MQTDYLFTRPSFWRGVASVTNLQASVWCNSAATPEQADTKALFSDWKMVGHDIRKALTDYGERIHR